jgi:hypothetical protein
MKKRCLKKSPFLFIILTVSALLLSMPVLSRAGGPALHTVTGQITDRQGAIITLDKKGIFYPATDMCYPPEWAKVGEKASLLYAWNGYRSCYYEIVQPGQKFRIQAGAPSAENQKH